MALVGSINFLLGMESSKFSAGANKGIKDMRRMQSEANGLRTSLGGINTALGAIGISVGIHQVIGFLREAHAAAEDAEQQQRKLNAVLEATDHAAGLSAEALNQQSDALSKIAAVDDDVITGAQALLLQFKRVKGDVFIEGTKLALDLSRAMDRDLSASMLLVGKALNDPIRGISLLRKAGVGFTEDQQATIKSMMEMNDVAAAQKIILEGLAGTVGGAAEKMRSSWDALIVSVGNYKEAIGTISQTEDGKGLADWLSGQVDRATEDVERFTKAVEKDAPIWEKAWRFAQAFGMVGGVQNLIGPNDPFLDKLPTESDAGPTRPDRPLPPSEAALRKLITDVGPEFAKGFTDELPGLGEMFNRMREQERGMRGGAFGNDPVGRALNPFASQVFAEDFAGELRRQQSLGDFLSGGKMLGGLDLAQIHAIDSAIDRTRQAEMGDDMPEIRDRQFAGAAMRGSEEAFATIAAFQGSRESDRVAQRAREQLEATKAIEDAVRANFIEVELQPIA